MPGGNPDFIIIPNRAKGEPISSSKKYFLPEAATHVKRYNGRVFFAVCLSPEWLERDYKDFLAIPIGARWISFPEYRWKEGPGHFYGEPLWGFSLLDEYGSERTAGVISA